MRKTEVRTINGHCHVLKTTGIIRENKESRYAFVINTCIGFSNARLEEFKDAYYNVAIA